MSLSSLDQKPVIAIFAHKRPYHLGQVLNALASNADWATYPLRIFIDGARSTSEQLVNSLAVSQATQFVQGHLDAEVIVRRENYGLYRSLTEGISDCLRAFESIIVLEDDIALSPFALQYFFDALQIYKDNSQVCSIHAYLPPIKANMPETFFLRGADCWGWATWRDQWALFRSDASQMCLELNQNKLVNKFNLEGACNYYQMLQDRASGKNNSWAICWHASCFLSDRYTLHPGRSLVANIGLDSSGEHCEPSEFLKTNISPDPLVPTRLDIVEADIKAYRFYVDHFKSASRRSRILTALKRRLRPLIRQLLTPFGYAENSLSLLGPYKTFQEASAAATGYDDPLILDKVRNAVIGVLEGRALYERDGTCFLTPPKPSKTRQILVDLLASSDLNIVDFGGGLGGVWINHKDLFGRRHCFTVIEQPNFVEAGHAIARQYALPIRFVENLAQLQDSPNLIVFSSVLQYVPNFDEVIASVLDLKPEWVLIDRTAFSRDKRRRWWLQNEPVYYGFPISYPMSPLHEPSLINAFIGYKVVERWTSKIDPQHPSHRGLLLRRTNLRS